MKDGQKVANRIVQYFEDNGLIVLFEANESNVLIEQNVEGYNVRFVVHYDKELKKYLSADYLTPEEGRYEFTLTEITDIEVCFKDYAITFNDDVYQGLKESLEILV